MDRILVVINGQKSIFPGTIDGICQGLRLFKAKRSVNPQGQMLPVAVGQRQHLDAADHFSLAGKGEGGRVTVQPGPDDGLHPINHGLGGPGFRYHPEKGTCQKTDEQQAHGNIAAGFISADVVCIPG